MSNATIDNSSESELGYQVGNLKDLEERYKCSHCHLLLKEPMQADCGHRYCKNCVLIKFNEATKNGHESLCTEPDCETGERTEISPDRVYPDNALKREIHRTLQVQCPNTPCEQMMLLKNLLEDHMPSCEFRPERCDLCGELVCAAKLASDHKVNDCPKRIVPCDACQEPVAFDFMEEHKNSTCIGVATECEFCQDRIRDDENEKQKHLKSQCLVGWQDEKSCPYGCSEMSDGWRDHRLKSCATHLDVVLAKFKMGKSDQPQPANDAEGNGSIAAAATPESNRRVAASAAVEIPKETRELDYEEVQKLKDKARTVEGKLLDLTSPAAARNFNDEQKKKGRELLIELQSAVTQGDKMQELIELIKNQFDSCMETIRQHEIKMQKALEKKLDMERRNQELTKLLLYKEIKISDLERRADILDFAGFDGNLLWKISSVRRRMEEARQGTVRSFYSFPFFTSKAGYKMCGRLYLNGDGAGLDTHISLYFVIMRGSYDALLPWPFAQKVSMTLVDQRFEQPVVYTFKPDPKSASFRRPATEMNVGSGCSTFVSLKDFDDPSRGFLIDDTMFIRFTVDKTDLP